MFMFGHRIPCVMEQVDTMRADWNWISILLKVYVFGASPRVLFLAKARPMVATSN